MLPLCTHLAFDLSTAAPFPYLPLSLAPSGHFPVISISSCGSYLFLIPRCCVLLTFPRLCPCLSFSSAGFSGIPVLSCLVSVLSRRRHPLVFRVSSGTSCLAEAMTSPVLTGRMIYRHSRTLPFGCSVVSHALAVSLHLVLSVRKPAPRPLRS